MRLSRRRLLHSAGAALLAAPFYRLLAGGHKAHAAGLSKRLILWFSPNGTVHEHWRPSGDGAAFDFPAGSILEPLKAHKPSLLVLDGLDFERPRGGSHEGGMEHMLTGGGAASVDQFIAKNIGGGTPFASIELGVQTSVWGAGIQTRMSYDDTHGFVHPEDDPSAAYRRLFGGGMDAASGAQDTTSVARHAVLDLLKGELTSLEKELGHEERGKLDAHLTSLRQLERQLDGAGGSCGGAAKPMITDTRSNERFPDVGKLQTELLVAAAACDLSRVLSLQFTHTVSPTIMSWAGAGEGHHELSHKDDGNKAGVAAFVQTERWLATQFASLLDQLAATQEADGSGSLLDTSTVVWVKELGDGRLHDFKSVPFIIAGRGNGYFAPGRYLKFGDEPHQRLLVSLCQAMGVDVDSFGVSDITGALSGLTA